jgi:hypothetical protein
MAQATRSPKSNVEIIFYVSHFNFAPCMAIMFLVHYLHLPGMIVRTENKGSSNKTSPLNMVKMQQTFSM